MATTQPTIYLIAGCNGAGKTTFAREFLPRERVKKGGHPVPVKDIRRRFTRGMANFIHEYAPQADRWAVWNTLVIPPELRAQSGTCTLMDLGRMLLP